MSELATSTVSASPAAAPGPEDLINITTLAASKVNEIREAEAIEGNQFLRLRVVGGGCAGFSYDLELIFGLEQPPQSVTKYGVIIGDQDPHVLVSFVSGFRAGVSGKPQGLA